MRRRRRKQRFPGKTPPRFFKREGRGSGEPAPARHNTAPCCPQKPRASRARRKPLLLRSCPRRPRRRKRSALTLKTSGALRPPEWRRRAALGTAPAPAAPGFTATQAARARSWAHAHAWRCCAGLASSDPARRGAVRSLPFALQPCAGGCLLHRVCTVR